MWEYECENKYTNIATLNLSYQLTLETKAATEFCWKKKWNYLLQFKKTFFARVYFGGKSLKLLFPGIYFREFLLSSAKTQNLLPAKISSIKESLFVSDKS